MKVHSFSVFRVISSIFIALLLIGTFYDIIFIQLDLKQKLKTAEWSTDVTNITCNSTKSISDEHLIDQDKKPIIPPNKTPSKFCKQKHLLMKMFSFNSILDSI